MSEYREIEFVNVKAVKNILRGYDDILDLIDQLQIMTVRYSTNDENDVTIGFPEENEIAVKLEYTAGKRIDFLKEELTDEAKEILFGRKDAKIVVRCGECECGEPDADPQNDGKKYVWCKHWHAWKPENGFCDMGKKKKEAEK